MRREYDAEGNRTVTYHWKDAYPWNGEVDAEDTFTNRVECTWPSATG